jgi:hypothetical protein
MNEIEIRNIEDVTIASELVASGGGNYYRNKINFHLSLSKPLSRAESHDFTTELHLVEKEWEVRLVKGPARHSHQSKNDESHQIILEEEVDMSLEDFEHIRYRFPLSQGVANVEFKILDGKVNPVVTHH